MTPLRRRRAIDPFEGSLDREYPPVVDDQGQAEAIQVRPVGEEPPRAPGRRGPDRGAAPSLLRRFGQAALDLRRRALPLPDELVDDYLATGEVVIHSDHPSFRSFLAENTLVFIGLLVGIAAFLGIAFHGSFAASAVLFVILALVTLVLVFKRLEERYTSYVVTDSRIMRLQGIVGRRAHSIPWVRVTDLTIQQNLRGRIFGFATLRIESANEASGLRDLEGVSDPLLFTKHVVDMVVAKQGATQPKWAAEGVAPPPQTERGLRRVRMSRRRRAESTDGERSTASEAGSRSRAPEPFTTSGRTVGTGASRRPPAPAPADTYGAEVDESLDAEQLASELRAVDDHDLPWNDDQA